jgi:hypothetical protein
VVLEVLGEEEEGGEIEMSDEPIIRESTATRVIFARVPVNLQTRVKHRADKYGCSINDVARVALERWCEMEEEAEMTGLYPAIKPTPVSELMKMYPPTPTEGT